MNSSSGRWLSLLCHASLYGSPFVLPIAIPLLIWQTSNHQAVRDNAKEAVNFFINYLIFSFISGPLTALIFTERILLPRPLLFLYLGAIAIVTLVIIVLPAIAIISVLNHPLHPFRYPFIRRFL